MAKTPTENIDALRVLLNANRGAQELLTVFEDAQAAQQVLNESQARLAKVAADEQAARTRLTELETATVAATTRLQQAEAEAQRAIDASLASARAEAARLIDEANAKAQEVERESAARISEANAKAGVAEAALAETTRQYEDIQEKLNAIKAQLG